MSSAWSMPLRAFATQTAVITMIGIGLAAPASAAQGDLPDNASDTATSATAEASEKQAERTKADAESTTTATTTRTEVSANASAKSSTKADRTTGSDHSMGNAGTSGVYNTPQPLSNADENTGGANGDCGAYCSTRKGLASMNGKGDGQATGKPCAGCVGKADNKNPPGQYPDGSDHNAGYECDRNQGIGKTNPAHTGCTTQPSTSVKTCPDGSPMPASGDIKDCSKVVVKTCPDGSPMPASGDVKDCVKVLTPGGGGGSVPPGIGGVDTEVPGSNRPPVVAGVETLVPPAGVEMVRPPASVPQAQPGAAALPATGATPAMTALSALALAMLTLGSLLLYRRASIG